MSVNFIDEYIDDDVQLKIAEAQALLKVTNLDLLREVVAEVRYKVGNGMPMLSNQRRKYILAIKAIDKQIPYKPDYWGDGYDENGNLIYDCAKCPNCGNDDFEYGVNNWGCKFCPDCGQALDWSDIE